MVPAVVDTITGWEEQEKQQGMVKDPDSCRLHGVSPYVPQPWSTATSKAWPP